MTIESSVITMHSETPLHQSHSRIVAALLITTLLTGTLMIVDININSTYTSISLLLILVVCFFVYSYSLRLPVPYITTHQAERIRDCQTVPRNYLSQNVRRCNIEKDLPPSYTTAVIECNISTACDTLPPPSYYSVIKEYPCEIDCTSLATDINRYDESNLQQTGINERNESNFQRTYVNPSNKSNLHATDVNEHGESNLPDIFTKTFCNQNTDLPPETKIFFIECSDEKLPCCSRNISNSSYQTSNKNPR